MKLEDLVEQFAQNVAAQNEAIFRGDAKTWNKHARKYGAVVDKLLAHGNAGRDALAVLKWTPFFGPPSSLRFEPTPT